MALLLPRLSKSSGSSVRINVWRQRRASVAPIGRVFPKSPDLAKKPDETLDLTTIGLSNKHNLLFPVVGNDQIPSSPMDYKKITDDDNNSTELYCTAPNLPELPGLPGERRALKTPTEPPDFCLKGEGQRLPSYVIGASKIENSPGGMILKSICTQLQSWFETLSGQNVDEASLQEELKRLLYIKKMRIYLEVRKKIYSPEVHCVPIFHCPCCLERWTVTGWTPENCPNSIQPTRGPEVVMYGTKMRFISMHPKGKTTILNRRQEYPKRKIGIQVGMPRPPYASLRAKERQDSPSDPHPPSTNPSRASNHFVENNEEDENKEPASDVITLRTSYTGEMYAKDTFSGLEIKSDRREDVEATVRSGADELEGIPQSRASMSLIQSISQNDDHYNEYARSSSRNGRPNEWKRRNTCGGYLCSDDPKSPCKTHKVMSPVPLTLVGDDEKSKMSYQKDTITPASSNDSVIEIQKDFDLVGKVEPTRSNKSKSEDKREENSENLQSAEFLQREDQERERKRNQTAKDLKETEGMSEKQGVENMQSTGEEQDHGRVTPLLRHSALKTIDQVNTKHEKREKSNVTWSDKKVLPKVSRDSHKGSDQERRKTTSIEVPDVEARYEEKATRSLPSATQHFKEASKALKHVEKQLIKPENQVIKHYLGKLKPRELQPGYVHSQRIVESSVEEPSVGNYRTDKDRASAGRSYNKPHHPISSEKDSLAIKGAQETFTVPHRRRTENLPLKKERRTIIKRPKHAIHSKEIVNVKEEALPIKPLAFIQPQVVEATALYAKDYFTDTHNKGTLITNDADDENSTFSTAVLPTEHVQEQLKPDIQDDFRTVVADIRNDIEVVDLELSSRLTPTVKKGNKIVTSYSEDDGGDDFFEEVDSKTALFSPRISSAIHRLPLSNAFTFSFYELPSQYNKRNKKLQMAALKIGHAVRKRTI